ncbi:MAG: 50S ribosomal protein L28 [Candidatus Eisenbacteria bacterium]|nr:50S ribosomal protein L28 [Candidatus Eisenbacteria bacterium]
MAKRCDICGRGIQFGAKVSHAHNVSKRRWQPNLQRVRVVIDGVPKKIYVCTRCLRSEAVQKAIRSTAKTPAHKETAES